jgi:hypothetical protein
MRYLILMVLLLSLGLVAGCGEKKQEPNQMKGSLKDRLKNVKPSQKPH